MIVRMIQNFENKIELHVNRPETRIEKMQEMLSKDLEEAKKSQSIMNIEITEMNTLEGSNSRITEAEEKISEVEDRMVELNEAERKNMDGTSQVVLWLRRHSSTAGGTGSIPGRETRSCLLQGVAKQNPTKTKITTRRKSRNDSRKDTFELYHRHLSLCRRILQDCFFPSRF